MTALRCKFLKHESLGHTLKLYPECKVLHSLQKQKKKM